MNMNASMLDRRIQFRRAQVVDDGFQTAPRWNNDNPEADNYGSPVSASRRDVSDAEKSTAVQVRAIVDTRFVVRSSAFTRSITPIDRLVCEGRVFSILGIKQIGPRHRWLEISGVARTDQ